MHLAGHVENQAAGSVVGEAEVPAAAIQQLLQWLAKGPTLAMVEQLTHEELPCRGETGFYLRR